MDKFRIRGGRPLHGKVSISGAKNSALPRMAAALLTKETVTLHNIPYVRDIITHRRLLEDLGATVLTPELRTHKITAAHVEVFEAPYELVKTMRASVFALGPLLAHFGKAKVSLPGVAPSARGVRRIILSRTSKRPPARWPSVFN